MHDKLESLKMLLDSQEASLQSLLTQRSTYAGRGVPDDLERRILQKRETILELQGEIAHICETPELLSSALGSEGKIGPNGKDSRESDAREIESIFARIPDSRDLLPILVPHNLVLDLEEYRRVQETAFTVAGVMLGGATGILINWLTAGASRGPLDETTLAVLIAFCIGLLLSLAAGLWWGYRRAKGIETEISRYVKTMQLIRVPYSGSAAILNEKNITTTDKYPLFSTIQK